MSGDFLKDLLGLVAVVWASMVALRPVVLPRWATGRRACTVLVAGWAACAVGSVAVLYLHPVVAGLGPEHSLLRMASGVLTGVWAGTRVPPPSRRNLVTRLDYQRVRSSALWLGGTCIWATATSWGISGWVWQVVALYVAAAAVIAYSLATRDSATAPDGAHDETPPPGK